MKRIAIYITSLISVAALYLFNGNPTETMVFDVIRKDKKIGEFVATKIDNEDKITYKTTANISYRLIKKFDVVYQIEVNMSDEFMTTADAFVEVNDKIRSHTTINRIDGDYHMKRKGKNEILTVDAIDFPAILLLFREPINVPNSFSEEKGNFHTLHDMGDHSYKKVNGKGNENWYYYQDGKLQSAKIDAGLIKFEIVLSSKNQYTE